MKIGVIGAMQMEVDNLKTPQQLHTAEWSMYAVR